MAGRRRSGGAPGLNPGPAASSRVERMEIRPRSARPAKHAGLLRQPPGCRLRKSATAARRRTSTDDGAVGGVVRIALRAAELLVRWAGADAARTLGRWIDRSMGVRRVSLRSRHRSSATHARRRSPRSRSAFPRPRLSPRSSSRPRPRSSSRPFDSACLRPLPDSSFQGSAPTESGRAKPAISSGSRDRRRRTALISMGAGYDRRHESGVATSAATDLRAARLGAGERACATTRPS